MKLSGPTFICAKCGRIYTEPREAAKCECRDGHTNFNSYNPPSHEITLQLLDRAITYANNAQIPLEEAWQTIMKITTPKVTFNP